MASTSPFISFLETPYAEDSNSALLTWDDTLDEHCKDLSDPNVWNFALSVFILVGILVSYLPQHARIISRRSSEGLSPWFVLLGTTSGTSAIANIILLRQSQADVLCCRVNSTFSCAAGLLGIAQVGIQWTCFFAIMLLFLIFFPRDQPNLVDELTTPDSSKPPSWRDAVLVVGISVLHALLVCLISLLWFAFSPSSLQVWASCLGLAAAALACIQYVPQIYTTWRLQHVLSLSIPMMLIQTPGSFVFSFSLALRLGAGGWSAWGVYLVTGCLQGVLLGMAIGFELRDRKEKKLVAEGDANGAADAHERTPLLDEAAGSANGGSNGNGSTSPRYVGNGHETIKKTKLSIVHNADDGSPGK